MKVAGHGRPPVLAGACLSMASLSVRADDAVIVHYDIVGSSDRELRHELNAKGPISESGERGDGYTRWDVTWNFRYAPATGSCVLTETQVDVKGRITLPRWKDEYRGSSALVSRWQRFLGALRTHEDGHYAFGIAAANEIRMLGQSFRINESCSTMGETFNEKARSILEKHIWADKQYDAGTRHGLTQGARFP